MQRKRKRKRKRNREREREIGVRSQQSAVRRGSREAEASMEAIFVAIYSVWCSWVQFLLLFTMFGDPECIFCCYLLGLVQKFF